MVIVKKINLKKKQKQKKTSDVDSGVFNNFIIISIFWQFLFDRINPAWFS